MGWLDGISLTTGQMAAVLEMPMRTVIDWVERGVLVADLNPATGHGSRRLFSNQALLRAIVAKFLIGRMGIRKKKVKEWLDKMERDGVFLSPPREPVLVAEEEAGQLWINLQRIADETQGVLHGLA